MDYQNCWGLIFCRLTNQSSNHFNVISSRNWVEVMWLLYSLQCFCCNSLGASAALVCWQSEISEYSWTHWWRFQSSQTQVWVSGKVTPSGWLSLCRGRKRVALRGRRLCHCNFRSEWTRCCPDARLCPHRVARWSAFTVCSTACTGLMGHGEQQLVAQWGWCFLMDIFYMATITPLLSP